MIKLFFGIIVGAGIVWFLTRIFKPAAFINSEQIEQKRQNLEKILALTKEKTEVTNDDVQYSLHVSNATAERYLHELESEGKLIQIGQVGRAVKYQLKH